MTIDSINEVPADPPGAFVFAVDALREIQSAMAGLAAMEMALYAAVFAQAEKMTAEMPSPVGEREMALRTASAEIGAALRVSDRTVQRRMSHAWDVAHIFPQTFEALREGRITPAHVNAITRASDGLPAGDAHDRYEAAAIERAEQLSPGRLAAVLPAVAAQIHECGLAERHQRARAQRRVEVRDVDDGMAEVLAVLPAIIAHGMFDRLTSMAKACQAVDPDDERSRDEIRADILGDLVLGGGPVASGDALAAITARVQITVPVLTAAGVTDVGTELIGTGPIDAETARRLVGPAAGWDRVMTHPVNGAILAIDRYRPNEDLRRALRVRDEHCRFPGCRQPAHRCDADHSHAAADGGETCLDNMALLCPRHHDMKHAAAWIITHLGRGVLRWTSPSGRTYIDTPTPTLRFFPSNPDPDPGSSPGSGHDSDAGPDPGTRGGTGAGADVNEDALAGANVAANAGASVDTNTETDAGGGESASRADAAAEARKAHRRRLMMGEPRGEGSELESAPF
ncbi:HNH endonuclease signature motif containing protein [Microbacterium sp. NC79]|uniref:HNH endonuclease signature motif containing protein n=1 Tax=Microbacterium sp. NC79 TaxID=2851009 RepID=UPI001C2B8F42|nr:HNH endonuclease signature motif containing protein [Microbacterium sp. NC79]MBV0893816.1 DUF222 domain-containing protein [Microbacterium sp. NC79]